MDRIKNLYRQGMRIYLDRPDIVVPGRWRWCPPGAKPIPFFHLYGSASWDDETMPYEEFGDVRMVNFQSIPDDPIEGLKGDHFCGDRRMWEEGCLYSERGRAQLDENGMPACCGGAAQAAARHALGEVDEVGGWQGRQLWQASWVTDTDEVGGVQGIGEDLVDVDLVGGTQGQGEGSHATIEDVDLVGGVQEPSGGSNATIEDVDLVGGVQGQGEGSHATIEDVDLVGGVQGQGEGSHATVGEIDEVGGNQEAGGTPPAGPGATCGAAGTMALGTSYTATVAMMGNDWWKFPVVSGTTYRVRHVRNSGDLSETGNILSGVCGSQTIQAGISGSGCGQWTATYTGFAYVQISGGFGGSTNYTITAAAGTCP